MAIDTSCPSCEKRYKLKDDLAGKRVTCGNPSCRKAFVVPGTPSANGHAKAPPKAPEPPVDAEALAALAFAEEVEQQVPVDQRRVKMVCVMCEAKWEEPWERQGKNVLCPECKHRQKVPEQKTGKVDWRDPKAGRPTLAKVEELEGVQASTDSSHAGFESLKQAGVIEDNIEPRPRWHYVAWVTLPVLALGLAVYAGMLVFDSTTTASRDEDMEKAVTELLNEPNDTLPASEQPLFGGAIQIAAGEYYIRGTTEHDGTNRDKAVDYFTKARTELDGAPVGGGRDVMLSELAVAQTLLGGGKEEVDNETRIRWVPGPRTRNNTVEYDVQRELRTTLTAMKRDDKQSSYEVRLMTARRLARELAKKGQPTVMPPLISQSFTDAEQAEAEVWVAAESARGGNENPEEAAKALLAGLKAPATVPAGQDVSAGTRVAHTAQFLLLGNMPEALAMARRSGDVEGRGKAYALIAEWGDDASATEAVREAAGMVAAISAKGAKPSDYTLVRLAQAAGRTNQSEQADVFAKAINKDDYRAWAKAEALRAMLATEQGKVADEKRAEIPDSPKDHRVGQAWARMAVARHNAKLRSKDDSLRDIERWGNGFKPFGLAGLTLGLQDHEGK